MADDGTAVSDEAAGDGAGRTDAAAGDRPARWARPFYFCLGLLALGAGIVGVVLPLVPTTPFLLVAAFSFARSSRRLHRWLMAHPRLGPPIRRWRKHGAIRRSQKWWAIALMAATFLGSALAGASALVLAIQAAVLTGAGTFIATRPHGPDE